MILKLNILEPKLQEGTATGFYLYFDKVRSILKVMNWRNYICCWKYYSRQQLPPGFSLCTELCCSELLPSP